MIEDPILVLAGGRATRLGALAKERPKYLMSLIEPWVFADVHLLQLKKWGFRRVILAVGHLGEQIQAHCQDGSRWGLQITYVQDGEKARGTGGACLRALDFDFQKLFVTYGDTLLDLVPMDMIRALDAKPEAWGVMSVFRNSMRGHTNNADWVGPWIAYDKRHPGVDWEWIDYGMSLLRRPFLQTWEKDFGDTFDLSEAFSVASRQQRILGFEARERFWEIGSPEALNEALEEFKKRDFLRELRDLGSLAR